MAGNMIQLEQVKKQKYRTISLEVIESPKLSLKAKAIHTYLITRPQMWELRLADLLKRCKDGESSVRSALKELETAGYLQICRRRNERGHYVASKWIVTESIVDLPIFQE